MAITTAFQAVDAGSIPVDRYLQSTPRNNEYLMTIAQIIDEYDIEVDDVRWYLATGEAERVLSYNETPEDLAALIQSGRLEADWYRMEERYLEELQEKLDSAIIDESEVRKICAAIETARRKRFSS